MFGKDLSDKTYSAFMQFVKFGIVGGSNTIISYVLYAVSLLGIQKVEVFPKIDYLLTHIIAFVFSVLWSFYWNNKMVFVLGNGKNVLKSILLVLWV